jgi:hypothetical protein
MGGACNMHRKEEKLIFWLGSFGGLQTLRHGWENIIKINFKEVG